MLRVGSWCSSEGDPLLKLPPSAGDFCYGKSHQNHLRQTAAATRYPARLARHAPRRTRAIHDPRTIGACSPVALRCSAAFKARQVKTGAFLSVNALRYLRGQCVCAIRLLLYRRLLKSKSQDQELPPSAGDFCYGKSHQNHLRRTAAAARFPARLAQQALRRTRAIHGPRTIGACSPAGLRCSAAFKARQVKIAVFLPVIASRYLRGHCVCAIWLCFAGGCSRARAKSKSFRLRRVTFVTAKVTKTICAERLPLRGSLRILPDRRRAELGPSLALGQSALARLSGCDARQPSRRGKSKPVCFYR